MIQTCRHCGHKTNTHHNCNATCYKCGKPFGILTNITMIGTLDADYEVKLKQVPVSSSSHNMYHYEHFVPHLNMFVSKTNELYKIDGWFGHDKDLNYWHYRITM